MTERVVRRGDVDLFVREWGSGSDGAATVVLVHGYPDTGAMWIPVAERLAERYHVVAHDVRGAGRSSAPRATAAYRLAHLVDDLAAVIDATSPDRPVHLVAHDWGSIQAWEAVTTDRLAGRIASYTSMSGPSLDHAAFWVRDRLRWSPGALRQLGVQLTRSWYVGVFHLPGVAPMGWRLGLARQLPRALERLEGVARTGDYPAPTLAADGRHGVKLYRANFGDRLRRPRERRTSVPVQVLVPTGDRYVSPALSDDLDRWVERLWRRPIAAGHWAARTHPDLVASAVADLVDHVDGGPEPRPLARARVTGGRRPYEGWLVVVTGAGSGIGRATALEFASSGAAVVAADIDGATAARTAELARLAGSPDARSYRVDVGDTDAMESFAKWVEHELGVPDVVVNNAGIGMAGGVLATAVDDWERIMRVNLWGVIHGCRLFAAQMISRGEGGHIVNVASAAAFAPSRTLAAYSTTKAAVLMLSECLRAELAGRGIGVTAVCPGIVDTPITTTTRFVGLTDEEQERRRRSAARFYRRRGFPPERVAAAVVDAVEHNRSVVPVAPEAKALQVLWRWAPGVARRLARLDLTPR